MKPLIFFRIISALLSLLFTFIITDSLILFLPGDPIELLMEETGSTLDRNLILEQTRMNLGKTERITEGLKSLSHFEFGTSLLSGQKITPILMDRALKSIQLATSVFLGMMLISTTLAPLAALLEKQNKPQLSKIISTWGWISNSVSTVWIGPIFLIVFTLWIPIADSTESFFLAWFTLIILITGNTLRIVRERVRESVQHGSVRGALALGFGNIRVALKHGFMPVSSAIFGFWGTQFGSLMAGAFITEVLFGLDGLGSLLIDSVLKRDFPVIQGALFISTSLCILGNFVGDLAQNRADPRIRLK